MKKFLTSIILCFVLVFIVGCVSANNDLNSSFKMVATIQNIGEKIEVDVVESKFTSGIYLVITEDETEFYNAQGKQINRDDLNLGDKIEIFYGGQVMMSYPPQIVAKFIIVL